MARTATVRPPARPRPAGAGIRWDRLGRVAVLVVLAAIVLLYASPLQQWIEQRRTAGEHAAEVQRLEAEHARLQARARDLARDDAIEREARRLGMVRQGERAYVIEP
jgi:cell division protein FtsB